jgi:Sulfatase-modifying factor enzyme 1
MDRRTSRLVVASTVAMGATLVGAGVLYLLRASRQDASDGAHGALSGYRTKLRWRSVRARHWQVISTDYEDAETTDAAEGTGGECPSGMVQIRGERVVDPDDNRYAARRIETMQLQHCSEWIQQEYPERCQQFDAAAWEAAIADLGRESMSYCIDRFEYPNIAGQYPIIYVSFYEAKELCAQSGKRLCSEDEWTFACEGEGAKPYPYGDGYTRDPDKCITDQRWRAYNERNMIPRDGAAAAAEMDRLWQGKPSGSQTECRSEHGVFDMTGNVDEWTTSTTPGERPSILKGGYWGPVRTRCRPSTRGHDQNHVFYQQGFRCCADVGTVIRDPAQPRLGEDDPAPAHRLPLK